MKRLVALAAAVGILVVGCGGSQDTPPAAQTTTTPPTTAPSPTSGIPEVAKAYLEAFVAASPKMLELSAPGSPAHAMAQTHVAGTEAALAEGHPYPPETVSFEGSTARTCFQGPSHSCYDYSDFEFDAAGRLASFTVNGVPLAGRIVGGGQAASAVGAQFALVGALQTVTADSILVYVRVQNGRQPLSGSTLSASYVGPDGRQTDVTDRDGSVSDLQPGATTAYVFRFQGARLGGTLHLNVWTASFSAGKVSFKL